MSNVKLDSKQTSDAMSLTQRQLLPQKRSERGYLADQAADARLAMVHTLQDMKQTVIQVADVRSCTKRHPWLVIGSAVAAGFVAGTALTPSARTNIKHTGSNSEALLQPGGEGQGTPQSNKSVLFSIVGTVLASILQTVVQGSIAAAVAKPRAHQKVKRRRRRVAQNRSGTVARADHGDS
jgi:ElaB/YqjD/DUF883 family membrane-anchored ribosome-binding protein